MPVAITRFALRHPINRLRCNNEREALIYSVLPVWGGGIAGVYRDERAGLFQGWNKPALTK